MKQLLSASIYSVYLSIFTSGKQWLTSIIAAYLNIILTKWHGW